jgi:hypothetical protein
MIADLYVENLPMANNIEMRNRLRTIVPPEIIEAGKTGKPIPPKPPQPDPMLQMKMQEMQLKHQQIMMQGQLKMKEIEIKEKDLHLKGITTSQDMSIDLQRLEAEKLEAAAGLQEQELRYQAEMNRTNADMSIAHADNLVKLLTHTPLKENSNERKPDKKR